MIKERHKAIYGKIKLERMYCESCKGSTIVLEGIKQCCEGAADDILSEEEEIMVSPRSIRKSLSQKRKKEILKKQDNKCLYCDLPFGTPYLRKNVFCLTRVNWDHLVPFSYTQTSGKTDFVASCNICNLIKSDKMFKTVEDARRHIQQRRIEKGYEYAD